LVNRCITLLNKNKKDTTEIYNILNELISYTQEHFQREELLMKACKYPGLIKHKQVHQLLTKEVERQIKEYYLEKLTAKKLLDFLTDWISSHISVMDKAIEPYCKGKESKIKSIFKNLKTTNIESK